MDRDVKALPPERGHLSTGDPSSGGQTLGVGAGAIATFPGHGTVRREPWPPPA